MTWWRNRFTVVAVKPNRRGMSQDLRSKTTKLKRGDIRAKTRANLTAILWRDKKEICMLTNIHSAPAEGNISNEGGKAIKPQIVIVYNHHMGYVDKVDRMANSYSISRRTFKWTKNLFFHLLDLAVLNSYILHSSCGGKKMSHRDFRYTLVRNILAHARPERRVPRTLGRPPNVESHVARLEVCGSKHWPVPSETQLRRRVYKVRGVTQKVCVKCRNSEKNMFWRLPHKGTILISGVTFLRKPGDSSQYVSKRNWNFCIFHTIRLSIHELKLLLLFWTYVEMSLFYFPKSAV